jgi:hypothetical protein
MTVRSPVWLSSQIAEQAKEDGRTKNSAMLRAAEFWMQRRNFRSNLDAVGNLTADVGRKLAVIQSELDRLDADTCSQTLLASVRDDLENVAAMRNSMSLLVKAAGG